MINPAGKDERRIDPSQYGISFVTICGVRGNYLLTSSVLTHSKLSPLPSFDLLTGQVESDY